MSDQNDLENEAREVLQPQRKLRRSIYILPSLLTVGNIFCGFFAIVSVLEGDYGAAAVAVGIAILLDGMDGRVARLANATSDFGLQLDSLADIISFGVAPAMLLYSWGLSDLGRFAQFSAFLFLVCGAMRLARFNVQSSKLKNFAGLPIPGGAGFVASTVHFFGPEPPGWPYFNIFLVAVTYAIALLMISTLRYPSLKKLDLGKGKSHLSVAILALLVAGVIWYSQIVLLVMANTYILSGLMVRAYQSVRLHGGARKLHEAE